MIILRIEKTQFDKKNSNCNCNALIDIANAFSKWMDFYAAQFIIVAHKKLSMSFLIACRSCGRARLQLRYQCTIDEVEHFCVFKKPFISP